MAFPDCSHVSATDTSRPTGADYIYCLAQEVRKLKESIAAGNGVFDVLAANVIEPLPTGPCDPYWADVVCACHFDAETSPGSYVYIDEAGLSTIERLYGTPAITADVDAFGGNCLESSASITSITLPAETGTSFTIEARYKEIGITNARPIITFGNILNIMPSTTGLVRLLNYYGGEVNIGTPTTDFMHVAICVDAGMCTSFVNGIKSPNQLAFAGGAGGGITSLLLGGSFDMGQVDKIRIEEIIITNAVKYTVDFTPPTSAFATTAC